MKIVQPSYEILTPLDWLAQQVRVIERAGRVCYKSEDKITDDSALPFACKLANVNKHESVIEHSSISVLFICDRGVSHELVRHRLASFSQESSRYCNYSKDKFGNEISVIIPPQIEAYTEAADAWEKACRTAERCYFAMLRDGCKPEIARSVLPTCLKTEVVVTANFREWRHIFNLRTAENAHPQIRELMLPLQKELAERLPGLF